MKKYYPEGARADIEVVEKRLSSPAELKNAFLSGESLEARAVLCDRGHNLDVDLRCMKGFMPREECAMGIENNTVRDIAIISRVNKPVDFVITGFSENERGETFALLSRRKLQEECAANYTSRLIPGDIIDARVTHLEPFGAFCDIGAGISALMPIDGISVSRIPHPCVRFSVNQDIKAVVKSIDENGRITLSQKGTAWHLGGKRFKIRARRNRARSNTLCGGLRYIRGACAQSCRACRMRLRAARRRQCRGLHKKHKSRKDENKAYYRGLFYR